MSRVASTPACAIVEHAAGNLHKRATTHWKAVTLLISTMRPPLRMCGTAACTSSSAALMLMSSILSIASAGVDTSAPAVGLTCHVCT